jgi:alpha-1,2-mannosyltransferase
MWLVVFTCQPHKEERFMFPAYPFLALNAAIALYILLSYIGSSNPQELIGRIPPKWKSTAVLGSVLLAINLGLLRTVGMVTAYKAPLLTLEPLEKPGIGNPGDYVCFGKEWYRFPSSFFLPDGMRAKFVRSEFRGLLPGEFAGTWVVPSGMNDRNQEDPGKYVGTLELEHVMRESNKLIDWQTDISHCMFLVDSFFPGSDESKLQPHHVLDNSTWEAISCHNFLDAGRTGVLGRVLWIPEWSRMPNLLCRKWGRYCLLRRRKVDDRT